jgi:hypothetical protein
MCEKIQSEENTGEKIEEINSSDMNDNVQDSESEDDPLLIKLQGNILGVLTFDKPISHNYIKPHKQISFKEEKKAPAPPKKQNLVAPPISKSSAEKPPPHTTKKEKSKDKK